MLTYTDIDLDTASNDDIKKDIERLSILMNNKKNEEQAIKIFINSIYGAIGNKYFFGFNTRVAEAITLQGQDVLNFIVGKLNKYFTEFWHRDSVLHDKINITNAQPIKENVVRYCDTDSVSADTIIHTKKHGDITIEKLYSLGKEDMGNTLNGHESVSCSDSILNYKDDKLYYCNVKRVIRHKVTKTKFLLKTKDSKIYITSDHSLVVWRNHHKEIIKPKSVQKGDLVLISIKNENKYLCQFEPIVKCTSLVKGYCNEYVYDIETEDETHTFIGNDILVHNSAYVTFQYLLNSCEYKQEPLKLIFDIYENRLNSYINKWLDIYAQNNGVTNIHDFELETISHSIFFQAKKKYVKNKAWKDGANGGIFYKSYSKIEATGVELIQSSTPLFARKRLKDLLIILFEEKHKLNMKKFIEILKGIKADFVVSNIDDICLSMKITDYNKSVIDDVKEIKLSKMCPMHVRASAHYNYLLNNSKYKSKYNIIKSGDKIKYYFTNDEDNNVFGFLPGNYPIEIAPDINYDVQFNRCIISPINRFIQLLGFPELSSSLVVNKRLF